MQSGVTRRHRSLSASLNGRWNEAEPDSRTSPRLLGLVWPFIVVVLLQAMLAGGSPLRPLRGAAMSAAKASGRRARRMPSLSHPHADSRADEDFRRSREAIAIPSATARCACPDQPDPDMGRPARASSRAATMPTTLPRSSGCTATSTTSVTSSAPSSCGWWATSTSWN